MKKNQSTHEFAVYLPHLVSYKIIAGGTVTIADKELAHRIVTVLRLRVGEACVFFDREHNARVVIEGIDKKSVLIRCMAYTKNKNYEPRITCLLPVLKRDALEAAIYALVELGVNEIQLIETSKTHSWLKSDKEYARLERIMIAAAEQSKHFSFSHLDVAVSYEQALQNITTTTPLVFGDPTGLPLVDVVAQVKNTQSNQVFLLVGPEGDLTEAEKQMLQSKKVFMCALTPTILRAHQAVALLVGVFRSVL